MSVCRFVAGEQLMTVRMSNVFDAWLSVEVKAKTKPIASEFRELPIEAWDDDGFLIAVRDWQGWHEAVLQDTYGSNWQEHLENAGRLM